MFLCLATARKQPNGATSCCDLCRLTQHTYWSKCCNPEPTDSLSIIREKRSCPRLLRQQTQRSKLFTPNSDHKNSPHKMLAK
eukprot:12069875-Heterocapsa_arctica.AAC.1